MARKTTYKSRPTSNKKTTPNSRSKNTNGLPSPCMPTFPQQMSPLWGQQIERHRRNCCGILEEEAEKSWKAVAERMMAWTTNYPHAVCVGGKQVVRCPGLQGNRIVRETGTNVGSCGKYGSMSFQQFTVLQVWKQFQSLSCAKVICLVTFIC